MSKLIYIRDFLGGIESQPVACFMLNRYDPSRPGSTRESLPFVLRARMHYEHMERLANRTGLWRIERELEVAIETAECVLGVRIFLEDYICGQFLVVDELHARSLSQLHREMSV